jgi:hypothetical protein
MTETYLRDVLQLPESVHAGDFKVELTGGFTDAETATRVGEYVITDQLREAFREALSVVRSAVRDGHSHAAYLHGSFGSGKSHFLTVLRELRDLVSRGLLTQVGQQPVDALPAGHRARSVVEHVARQAEPASRPPSGTVDGAGSRTALAAVAEGAHGHEALVRDAVAYPDPKVPPQRPAGPRIPAARAARCQSENSSRSRRYSSPSVIESMSSRAKKPALSTTRSPSSSSFSSTP